MRRRLAILVLLPVLALAALNGSAGAASTQVVANGGFESGSLVPWQGNSHTNDSLISNALAHSGSYSASLCGVNSCDDQIWQTLTLPSSIGQAVLSYWVYVSTAETSSLCYDALYPKIRTTSGTTLISAPRVCNSLVHDRWVHESLSVPLQSYQNRQVQLFFVALTNSMRSTTFYVDDVTLTTTPRPAPTTTPTPTVVSNAGTAQLVSSDPYPLSAPGQHSSEVEPAAFAYGSTFVTAFQVGRFFDGGSTDIGFATENNGTWQHGLLPGLTSNGPLGGSFPRATDASVAYDARHGAWLIVSLGLADSPVKGLSILVNRSSDGVNWSPPVRVANAPGSGDYDKTWLVCDNSSASPFFGHCYAEWDDNAQFDLILMSTSVDGGRTWSAPVTPQGAPGGLGGEPLVQPNGDVIVPALNASESQLIAFRSTDGGSTWSSAVEIAGVITHPSQDAAVRTSPLPSATEDQAGKVYVAWQDCSLEPSCSANDILLATSMDGLSWSTPTLVPMNAVGSNVDHFIPAIAVDPNTWGRSARIALTYYYSGPTCSSSCPLYVGFISSINGGTSWSSAAILAGPVAVSWLPGTDQGRMVGDYISTTFMGNQTLSTFPVAEPPNGQSLDQSMYVATEAATGGSAPAVKWKPARVRKFERIGLKSTTPPTSR